MKKKIIITFVMLLIMFFMVDVKASDYWEVYSTIEKGENSGELYNLMPTEVQKGDIVSVKLIVQNADGWEIPYIISRLEWDSQAFEIVETNGKYHSVLNNSYSCYTEVTDKDSLFSNCPSDGYISAKEKDEILEFKFKVKKNAPDGVYEIRQKYDEESVSIIVNDEWEHGYGVGVLYYQVGTPKLVSDYTKDRIDSSTYVIGNYMFNHDKNDDYNGVLTTDYIMLASKSIESNDRKDMIIYYKNARGNWVNGSTDESITPPNEFEIEYKNMKSAYRQNGFYSNNDDTNKLMLIQLTEDKAAITIENNNIVVKGIATVNGNVATLTVNGKNYTVTIYDNSVKIETTDNYVDNETLQKRANYSVDRLYENLIGEMYAESYPKVYINSAHSGKYTRGNYELYLVRITDYSARICLKNKNDSDKCAVNEVIYNNEDGYALNGEETTYAFHTDEGSIGLNWSSDKIEVSCSGACSDNPYAGTYQKEKTLSMEDTIEVWQKNELMYNVTFVHDNGEFVYSAKPGEILPGYAFDGPDKDGYVFAGWKKENGDIFDPNTRITGPLVLNAFYKKIPGAPTLPASPMYDEYDQENNRFHYSLAIELDDEYDGFEIIKEDAVWQIVGDANKGETVSLYIDADAPTILIARAYINVNGEKTYGPLSNSVTIVPTVYTVSFNSNGGSDVPSVNVPYNGKLVENDIETPLRSHYTFKGWYYEDEEFNFNTPIEGNITLVAEWENDIAAPTLAYAFADNYYTRGIYLNNTDTYCTNASGECNGDVNDHYYITGYELYEVVGENKVIVESNHQTQFAPHDSIDMTFEPNVVKNYVARAYIKEGAETVYSEYSGALHIDTMIPTPSISFDPSAGTLSSAYEVENWIKVSNLINTYGFDCDGNDCVGYKINGFILYSDDDPDAELQMYGVNDLIHVTANYGENKHYYLRAWSYSNDGLSTVLHSGFSNELVLDTSIKTPAIMLSSKGIGQINEPRPFWYTYGTGFSIDINGNYDIHMICDNPNDPNDCSYNVDGYELFEKNGNNEVSVDDGFMGGQTAITVPENTSKTVIARAYVDREGSPRLYSAPSNEIKIDLTNPVYTFEVKNSKNTTGKVYIKPYVNNFEVGIHGIKLNGTIYEDFGEDDEGDYVLVDSSLMNNVNTIEIGLEMLQSADPNNFIYSVNATRKTN